MRRARPAVFADAADLAQRKLIEVPVTGSTTTTDGSMNFSGNTAYYRETSQTRYQGGYTISKPWSKIKTRVVDLRTSRTAWLGDAETRGNGFSTFNDVRKSYARTIAKQLQSDLVFETGVGPAPDAVIAAPRKRRVEVEATAAAPEGVPTPTSPPAPTVTWCARSSVALRSALTTSNRYRTPVCGPRVILQSIATIRRANAVARSASPAVTMCQATACRSACCVSPALPAAVNRRARLFPGSENAASAQLSPMLLAARRNWSSSALSRCLMRGMRGTKASINSRLSSST